MRIVSAAIRVVSITKLDAAMSEHPRAGALVGGGGAGEVEPPLRM